MLRPDELLVLGAIFAVLSLPAVFTAVVEGRPPRIPAVMLVAGGAMIAWAVVAKPGGYTFEQIPMVFADAVRAYL